MAAGTVFGQRRVAAAARATRSVGLPLRFTALLVASAMFVCAFALWTAVPAAIIFALPRTTHADVGLPVVLVAVFVAMLAMTKVLALLDALYCRVMAVPPPPPRPPGWRRSYCEPTPTGRAKSVLETVVAASAVLSVVALAAWFLLFAHCGQGFCAA